MISTNRKNAFFYFEKKKRKIRILELCCATSALKLVVYSLLKPCQLGIYIMNKWVNGNMVIGKHELKRSKISDQIRSDLFKLWILLCLNAEPYRYQLRAYIYQGRDLLSGDSSGLSGNRFNHFNVRQSYCARYWYRPDVYLPICPSVCPSHADIVTKLLNLSSNCLHCLVPPWF